MSEGKIVLGSLALDLKRVAVGYHRGSNKMADRFMVEVRNRVKEAKHLSAKPYLKHTLIQIENLAEIKNIDKKAEYALTYSVIIQNYCLKFC